MKKYIVMLVSVLFVLTVSGCSNSTVNDIEPTDEVEDDENVEVLIEDGILKGGMVNYSVDFDEELWDVEGAEDINDDAEYLFEMKKGTAFALIIAEDFSTVDAEDPDSVKEVLKEVILDNMQAAATDFELVSEEDVTVNGVDMFAIRMNATIDGFNFTYYGYYYAGEEGLIQFITYTTASNFDKYEDDFVELLEGLQLG